LFRGGAEIGPATLANFFVLHVAFIPGTLFILLLWHFWLIRRAGGLVQAERNDTEKVLRVPSAPNLIVREAAVGLALVAFVLIMSILWNTPLLEQANPGMSPNPAKAPWYFLGFQELLLHLHPVFAVFVWPMLGAAALMFVPFWRETALPTGVWFGSERGRKLLIWTASAGALATLGLVLGDNLLLSSAEAVAVDTFITRGLLPTVLLIVLLAGLYFLLARKLKYTRAEAVTAGIVLVLVALIVCTVIGIWFRGPEMHLIWPLGQGGE
jgi:quinol-cytochrome oxidoreductase complex cytochrome b subunit